MKKTWKRSPDWLVDLYQRLTEGAGGIKQRKMFGYRCAFLNGNMFAGLHQESLVLRLDDESRNELISTGEADVFVPMKGRKMQQYVAFSGDQFLAKQTLRSAFDRSLKFASSLPPKTKRS